MQLKRWVLWVVIGFYSIIVSIGLLVYIVDPYFHFHAPISGISYNLDEYEYCNSGIIKNFEYDAFIIGTSLTECTSVDQINSLYEVDAVRLTFLGEGFKYIGENLNTALTINQDVKTVFWGLDTMLFISDKDYCKYDSYPTYLVDNNPWNDVKYLYNMDVLVQAVIPELWRTMKGVPADTFDDPDWQWDIGSKERVLNSYHRPEKTNNIVTDEDVQKSVAGLEENLKQNVLPIIESNPDVTFYIFFPPYSICWWDSHNQAGEDTLRRRIILEQKAIEALLSYENVKLFSFFNNFELITDLDNYRDDCHYDTEINAQILIWMKNNEYRLTQENYMQYIDKITDFYASYDYESIFLN